MDRRSFEVGSDLGDHEGGDGLRRLGTFTLRTTVKMVRVRRPCPAANTTVDFDFRLASAYLSTASVASHSAASLRSDARSRTNLLRL
jgi:hypothetical protein